MRNRRRCPVLVLILVPAFALAACVKGSEPESAKSDAEPASEAAPRETNAVQAQGDSAAATPRAKLKLGPVVLTTDDDPSRTVELNEDGTVRLGGRDVGVIDPVAGTLGTKEGAVVATLGEDGKVDASAGLPIALTETGLHVTLPNQRIYAVTFEADGQVTMKPADGSDPAEGEKNPPPISARGCEGDMQRTCAFLFGTMTFIVGTKKHAQ